MTWGPRAELSDHHVHPDGCLQHATDGESRGGCEEPSWPVLQPFSSIHLTTRGAHTPRDLKNQLGRVARCKLHGLSRECVKRGFFASEGPVAAWILTRSNATCAMRRDGRVPRRVGLPGGSDRWEWPEARRGCVLERGCNTTQLDSFPPRLSTPPSIRGFLFMSINCGPESHMQALQAESTKLG